MLRRRSRWLRCISACALAVPIAVVLPTYPAGASPALWERELDATNTPMLLTHPAGGVSVGGGSSSNPSAAQTVTANNGAVYKVPTDATPILETDPNLWVVDSQDTVYALASEPVGQQSRSHVVAYRNGAKLWDVVPPDTCPDQLVYTQAIELGADGNVYVVSWRPQGCSGQEFFLSGFDNDDGSVLFSTSLGGGFTVAPTTMYSYVGGLAVFSAPTKKIRYYSYAGGLLSETELSLARGEFVSDATATHQGRVYITVGKYRSTTEDCPYPWTAVSNRIEVVDQNGPVLGGNNEPLKFTVQPCASVYVQATPSGLVMAIRSYDLDDRLLALDATLQGLWDKAFDTATVAGREFMPWLGNDILVDNNGNVVTMSWYWRENQQYRGMQIKVLDGSNGTSKAVLYTDQLDALKSFSSISVGLSQGRLYLASHVCGAYQCSGSDETQLFATPAAGLGMDYPRARVAGQTPTTQTQRKYVALGDSFSAGDGVKPFTPPSDANGCHRSELAYARLLDEAPGLDLDLQGFVACSGATTWHVEHGQNGEPSQLNALGTDTDIVTITVGGNDANFAQFAGACVLGGQCGESSEYQQSMEAIENSLPTSLDSLLAEIEGRISPQTRVLVLGYPRMMPYGMDEFPNCVYLSEEERVAARTVTRGLNEALAAAVQRAGSQFEFVDADVNLNGVRTSPFAGHELCGEDTYFNGVSFPPGYSFHPNSKGHIAYQELVKEWLLTHP